MTIDLLFSPWTIALLVLRIALWLAAGAFGLLSAIAALTQLRKNMNGCTAPHVLMSIGGIGLLGAVVDSVLSGGHDWLLALIACGMICAAAVWNGKRSGSFHPRHHVVRGVLSAVLVIGFALL